MVDLQDVGQAILESYSRVLESLASKIMSRIEDVLEADQVAQRQSMAEAGARSESEEESAFSSEYEETEKVVSAETPNSRKLSDFIGWRLSSDTKKHSSMSDIEFFHKAEQEKPLMKSPMKSPRALPKKFSYLAKLENMRSPSDRH